MEEEPRKRRTRPASMLSEEQPEQPLEGVDAAWVALDTAVAAHAAVAQTNDTVWIRVGLSVLHRRAQAFVKAIESLKEMVEE